MENLDIASAVGSALGGVAVVASLIVYVTRWSNRKLGERIAAEIREATYAIHPDANGGLSLPDVARRTEQIAREVGEVKAQVDLLVDLYRKD